MSDAAVSPKNDPHRVPCSTCRELIRNGAQKCIHCDSYQGWRKHLTPSTAILALFVSFLAGASAAYPLIREWWRTPDSDLRIASAPVFQSGHVFVLMTNSGKKPGVVDLVTAKLTLKDQNNLIYLHLIRPPQAPDTGMIPGDSSKTLDFAAQFPATKVADHAWNPSNLTWDQLLSQEKELESETCKISVRVTSFKGVPEGAPRSCASDRERRAFLVSSRECTSFYRLHQAS
jgi:hypothetical protein